MTALLQISCRARVNLVADGNPSCAESVSFDPAGMLHQMHRVRAGIPLPFMHGCLVWSDGDRHVNLEAGKLLCCGLWLSWSAAGDGCPHVIQQVDMYLADDTSTKDPSLSLSPSLLLFVPIEGP